MTSTWEIQFKWERFILAHGVRGFSPRSAGPTASGAMVKQNIMAGGRGGTELLTSWWTGGRDRGTARSGQGIASPPQWPISFRQTHILNIHSTINSSVHYPIDEVTALLSTEFSTAHQLSTKPSTPVFWGQSSYPNHNSYFTCGFCTLFYSILNR